MKNRTINDIFTRIPFTSFFDQHQVKIADRLRGLLEAGEGHLNPNFEHAFGFIVAALGRNPELFKDKGLASIVSALDPEHTKAPKHCIVQQYFVLGLAFYFGLGRKKNGVEAFKHFDAARQIDSNNPALFAMLSKCYREGYGVFKDAKEDAVFRKAVEDSGSLLSVEPTTENLHLFLKAEKEGNLYVLKSLGDVYAAGKVIKKDDTKALDYYKKAVTNGSSAALFKVASCYKLEGDINLAAFCWRAIALVEGKSSEAMKKLRHYTKREFKIDYSSIFYEAAMAGDEDAFDALLEKGRDELISAVIRDVTILRFPMIMEQTLEQMKIFRELFSDRKKRKVVLECVVAEIERKIALASVTVSREATLFGRCVNASADAKKENADNQKKTQSAAATSLRNVPPS